MYTHTHTHTSYTHAHTFNHTSSHARTHKRGENPTTSAWYTLGNTNAGGAVTCKPYNSKSILNEKTFYYSILESSQGNQYKNNVIKNGGFI